MNSIYNAMLYCYTYVDVVAFHIDHAISERWATFRERRTARGER